MKEKLKFFLSILIGNGLIAFAVCAFVVPNNIMMGGGNGLALFLQQFIPVSLSVLVAVINVTLFMMGLIFLGWKFAATSLFSTIVYPVFLAIFEALPVSTMFNENIIVSALACGAVCGLGLGLVIRVGGSTGGMDIPPCILKKYKNIPVAKSLMALDIAVILMQVAVKGMDNILLSILMAVVISLTINKAVVSGEKKIQIIIISPKIQQIRQEILQNVDCGVTMIEIEGGYDGGRQQAILSVVYANKYAEIRELALTLDRNAFIVASDVTNVNGKGYTLSRTGE